MIPEKHYPDRRTIRSGHELFVILRDHSSGLQRVSYFGGFPGTPTLG